MPSMPLGGTTTLGAEGEVVRVRWAAVEGTAAVD